MGILPVEKESGYHNRYSDWLWTGWWKSWSLNPGRVNNLLFSASSKPALGPTQSFIQWVLGALSLEVNLPGHEADCSPSASAVVKKLWIYIHSPTCRYAIMLDE
jgi:hypothetical protein